MSVLLLITPQEVKDLTSMSKNTDDSKFRHFIQSAQDEYIKPAIGETCYNNLLNAVSNNDLTANETILLDGDDMSFAGLKTALAWWVLWLAYPSLWLTIGSSTIYKKSGDGFDSVSKDDFLMLRKTAAKQANYYTNYLIKYINENKDSYTCYVCDGLTDVIDETGDIGFASDWDDIK